jgi:ATP-dependent Lon protease
VIIPDDNQKDLAEIPANVLEGLTILPVKHVDEVLGLALTEPLAAIDWTEADELATQPPQTLPHGGEALRH